jgi:precorrin-2/cobalt-factor-2 C20-methyltransferase
MVADEAMMENYGESAAEALIEEAQNGKDVAFVCLGDPMLYGTGARILPYLKRAELMIEVIPGVSSFSLAAANARVPLALGHESLAVFPLAYGLEGLKTLMETCSSIVLIKPSRYLKEALLMAKSLNREVYRFSEGRFERLEGEPKENYFSLYIVLPSSKNPNRSP